MDDRGQETSPRPQPALAGCQLPDILHPVSRSGLHFWTRISLGQTVHLPYVGNTPNACAPTTRPPNHMLATGGEL